ncbi:tetratricopeptide repeat protein [Myroides injenensis]|uniref:tetratricopeptide repeat protein n=1 Tax=Myroides injenensis TaxID=1183151 RepID=UPI000288A45B|nr:tetratricopeptide repeat protein [Myroides injenensis]
MTRSLILIVLSISFLGSCNNKKVLENDSKDIVYTSQQEDIINQYVYQCAKNINYYVNMNDYQSCLDKGLKKDSTIAYLWQQKAMPYFKMRKYEVGMPFLEKAVEYNRKRYLPYKAFMECIFSKQYKEAIEDFKACIEEFGDSYEMDHTYSFYIGLSYLQLNQFDKAKEYFEIAEKKYLVDFGEVHHLLWFYKGIVYQELRAYDKAISAYDQALAVYPKFSDALFYKAFCTYKLENTYTEDIALLFDNAQEYYNEGFTINEDNASYEIYPYQIRPWFFK